MIALLLLACAPSDQRGADRPPNADGEADTADTDVAADTDTAADTEGDTPDTGTWPAPSSCAAAAWAWGADNTFGTAETSFVGEAVGDWAGGALTNAGDMDGDGRDDIVIGAPFRAEPASHGGKVYFIVGSGPRALSTPLAGRPAFVGGGVMELAFTFPLGDVSGDGLADVAIRPGYQNSAPPGGQYLVHGRSGAWTGSMPLDDADASTINADNTDGSTDVMSQGPFGDLDGDSVPDWFMWTPAIQGGEMYVVSGAHASGTLTLPGDAMLWLTGAGEPLFGDLDGDGLTDILSLGTDRDALSFIYGSATPPHHATFSASAVATLTGPEDFSSYDIVQDVSGDGVAELAVSLRDDGLYLFFGGTRLAGDVTLADADVHIAADAYAYNAAWLGDINGDGISDLGFLVDGGGDHVTDLYVVFGRTVWPAEIALGDADVHIARTSDMTEMMHAPEPDHVGDFDGDGIVDLLLRDPYEAASGVEGAGTVFLFSGRTSWPTELSVADAEARFSGSVAYEGVGESYHLVVQDYDGDGCDDIIASSYYRPAGTLSTTGETFLWYGQP